MSSDKAIVLLSSGMDSAVCASLAVRSYKAIFLHFQYGQRAAQKELECFHKLVEHFKPEKYFVIELPFFKQVGGSSLVDERIEIEEDVTLGIPSTYVPFRNGVFLSIAVAIAEALETKRIFIGVNQVDFSGYPDCREEFIKAMQKTIALGTKIGEELKIEAPLLHLSKAEIVKLGLEVGAPFHLTWSCYRGGDKACGRCPSCKLRLKAFAEAGVQDPIPYEL
jgi:7-cyano-7-deazaguanine synthase